MHPIIPAKASNGIKVDAMPADPEVITHFKGITIALLGAISTVLSIVAVGTFGDYFEANPLYTSIALTDTLGIDILGAAVPVAVAVIALMIFLKTTTSHAKKFTITILGSTIAAVILAHSTPDGLAGYPLLFALVSSAIAAVANLYPKPFGDLKKKLLSTMTLTLASVPLSLFIIDLAYSPYFSGAIIGGNGLTDGLLLSSLYTPLAVTAIFCVLSYVSEMILLIEKTRLSKKLQSPSKIIPVAPKKPVSQA
jgi:hypothetical protein